MQKKEYVFLFKLHDLLEKDQEGFLNHLKALNMEYCKLRQAGEKLQQLKKQDTVLASKAAQTITDRIYRFADSEPYRYFSLFAYLAFQIDKSERLDVFPINIDGIQERIGEVESLLSEDLQCYQMDDIARCHL